MGIFFTIVLVSLTSKLPSAFTVALGQAGAPELIPFFIKIPPTSALFSAFLGYNPVATILSLFPKGSVSSILNPGVVTYLEGKTWFPHALAGAFMGALRMSFYIGAAIFAMAALLSALRGKRYIYGESTTADMKEKSDSTVQSPLSSPGMSKAQEANIDPEAKSSGKDLTADDVINKGDNARLNTVEESVD